MSEQHSEILPPDWSAVLADPVVLRLSRTIAQTGEADVSELAEAVGLDQRTVSRHLEALHGVGLLERRQRGQKFTYRLGVLAGRALVLGLLPLGQQAA